MDVLCGGTFLGHFFSRTSYLLLVTSVSHIPGQIAWAKTGQTRDHHVSLTLIHYY